MSGPPFPANGSAIVAENLSRKFGTFVAVNDVSFRVEKGEIFGFLGPNGSGKTTVIKMLTGLLPLSGGIADRKSTRLNSSHLVISYAVFCLKKKNITSSRLL